MKEIRLTETDRRTLTCALSLFIDVVKAQEISEKVSIKSKTIALLSCANLIDAFDLGDFMEEIENVQ